MVDRTSLLLLVVAALTLGAYLGLRGAVPGAATAARPRTVLVAALLVAAMALVPFAPTLPGDFLSDDFGYLSLFHDQPAAHFLRLFHADISNGIWGKPLDELRPLFALSYRLTYAVFGVQPAGHQAFNLAVHALNALLLLFLVLAVTEGALGPALLAAALFAASPVTLPSVAWVTGRVDTLPTVAYLATLLAFVRFRQTGRRRFWVVSLLLFGLGLATKEILLTAPAALLALDVVFARARSGWARRALDHAPFFLAAAAWLVMRRLAFGSAVRAERAGWNLAAKLVDDGPLNLAALLVPASSTAVLGAFSAPVAAAAAGLMLGALVAGALSQSGEGRASRLRFLGFFAALFALTLLPTLVTYWTPRHLYLPAAAFYAVVGLLVWPPARPRPRWGPVLVGAAATCMFAVMTCREAAAWGRLAQVSRASRAAIARLAPTIPAESAVLVSVPEMERWAGIWLYALPFALSPPFMSPGLYESRQVVEAPDLYCCPLGEWWRRRKPLLLEWTDPARPPLDLYALYWSPNKGTVVMRYRPVRRDRLAARLQEAAGAPLAQVQEIDATHAYALVDALREAAIAGTRYGER